MPVDTLVVHPTAYALAVSGGKAEVVAGSVCAKPKITTGAGDHFNAGFCIGCLLGAPLDVSLQIGVATSGFYVRTAKSPTVEDMVSFLRTL